MGRQYLMMDAQDNVAVALVSLEVGDVLELISGPVVTGEPIPVGHKIALREIKEGEYIIKYGVQIGRATRSIPSGYHVHVHNVFDISEEVYEAERRKLGL